MIRALIIASLALGIGLARASEDPAHEPATAANELLDEAAQLTELAKDYLEEKNFKPAESILEKLLALPVPDLLKRDGLLTLAELHTETGDLAKAITVYDDFTKRLPHDPATPELHLKLGLLYRDSGANKAAIGEFYSVLNSTLKVRADDFETYRDLTRRAQFEIAETSFLSRDFKEALRFYRLVERLDLAAEDRVKTEFRALACHFALGEHEEVVKAARQFLAEHSGDRSEPEARHMSIVSLRALGRKAEAVQETLALLKTERARAAEAPGDWSYWQKTTGNTVANDFYAQGEFMNALTIYRSLAQVKGSPDWQWPAVYQMGLCFERLRLFDRAREAYGYIVADAAKFAKLGHPMSEALTACQEMAAWRRDQIDWQSNLEKDLHAILPPARESDLPEQALADIQTLP